MNLRGRLERVWRAHGCYGEQGCDVCGGITSESRGVMVVRCKAGESKPEVARCEACGLPLDERGIACGWRHDGMVATGKVVFVERPLRLRSGRRH